MTQENKELLLKDLCARSPYGVIVDYKENDFESPHWKITTIYPETLGGWIGYDKRVGAGSESGSRPFNIGDVKPYLRPMSSMTEEEKEDYRKVCELDTKILSKHPMDETPFPALYNSQDWLNKNMFDYRGLIEMGLAIEAPKNMYKID